MSLRLRLLVVAACGMRGQPHAAQVGHDDGVVALRAPRPAAPTCRRVSPKPCSSSDRGALAADAGVDGGTVGLDGLRAEVRGERLHLRQRRQRQDERRQHARRETDLAQRHARALLAVFAGRAPVLRLEAAAEVRQVREAPTKGDVADGAARLRGVVERAAAALEPPGNDVALEPGPLLCHERVGIAHADAGCRGGADRLQVRIVQAGFYRCLQHCERRRARVREVDAVRLGLRREGESHEV